MKSLLIALFLLSSFFVRALRWLGILQQKEYRLDRLFVFLKSSAGIKEVLRIFPKRKDFSRVGLKRPKFTKRSFLLTLIFIFLTYCYFKFGVNLGLKFMLRLFPYPRWYNYILYILLSINYLFFIPIFAMISNLPTVLLAYVQTYKRLMQASRKINFSKTKVIGITGSYGKTSTKILLKHVLETKYSVFMTPKSYNTKYSVANSIVRGYKDEEISIIEYAAYKQGEIKKLAEWITPKMAIITGLTKQHLGLFGELEDIVKSKAELVASLPKKSKVVCNVYDEKTKLIFDEGSKLNKAELVAVGPKYKKVKFDNVKLNKDGKLQFNWKQVKVQTNLIGLQYIEIIHLVIVTAIDFGLTQEEIVAALETFAPTEKFIYIYTLLSGARVIDDGDTCNPKGFEAMIILAKKMQAEKKILITPGIVDLGKESGQIHTDLAIKAKKSFNKVIYVGEDGKDEFKKVLTDDLLDSQDQLIEIISSLSSRDIIVLEGRIPAWVKQLLE